jgi:hypothetical protein
MITPIFYRSSTERRIRIPETQLPTLRLQLGDLGGGRTESYSIASKRVYNSVVAEHVSHVELEHFAAVNAMTALETGMG